MNAILLNVTLIFDLLLLNKKLFSSQQIIQTRTLDADDSGWQNIFLI